MAIRRADGRAQRTRDGAAGTRQRAGPSRRAWLAASLASADRRRLHARRAGWNSTGWQDGAAPRSLAAASRADVNALQRVACPQVGRVFPHHRDPRIPGLSYATAVADQRRANSSRAWGVADLA